MNNIHKINQIILSLIEKPLHYTFFYSIRDRDFFKDIEVEEYINRGKGRLFIWKNNHIENYLINEKAIYNTFGTLLNRNPFSNPSDCFEALKASIEKNKELYVNKLMKYEIFKIMQIKPLIVDNSSEESFLNELSNYQTRVKKSFRKNH